MLTRVRAWWHAHRTWPQPAPVRPHDDHSRYDYFLYWSEPAVPYLRTMSRQRPYQALLSRVEFLGYRVRFDTGFAPHRTRQEIIALAQQEKVPAREGFTVVLADRPPLAMLIRQMHPTPEELLDTLFHELIHATGLDVRRYPEQPDGMQTPRYWAEEIAAIVGGRVMADACGVSVGRARASMQQVQDVYARALGSQRQILAAVKEGHRAAQFLLEGQEEPLRKERYVRASIPTTLAKLFHQSQWGRTRRWLMSTCTSTGHNPAPVPLGGHPIPQNDRIDDLSAADTPPTLDRRRGMQHIRIPQFMQHH